MAHDCMLILLSNQKQPVCTGLRSYADLDHNLPAIRGSASLLPMCSNEGPWHAGCVIHNAELADLLLQTCQLR